MSLLDLYEACLANAAALVDEADLLLSNGHTARAYALGFTAYEEVGKSQIVADRFEDVVSEKEFVEAFHIHGPKAAYVGRHVRLPDGTVEYDPAKMKTHFEARNNALYVGRDSANRPLAPAQAVSRADAESVIRAVRKELDYIRFAEHVNGRIGTKGLFK
jgi:AbiV family abortive infection protein